MQETFSWARTRVVPDLQGMERLLLGGLLLLTLVSRLILSGDGTLPGDMQYWVRWSQELTSGGLRSFYPRTGADYLPIYPYVLWALGQIYGPLQHLVSSAFGWTFSRDALFKLPAIVADVATVHLLYSAGRRWTTPAMAGLAATVYAANPAIIANSARWGQVDSIPAYLMLLSLVLLIEDRIPLSGIVLALSVLTKPTALVLLPLIAVLLLRRQQFVELLQLLGAFLITGLIVVWPFVPTGSNVTGFVQQRFSVTTGTWSFATMKAFNLWALRQRNVLELPDSQLWLGWTLHAWGWLLLSALVVVVCAAAGIFAPRTAEDLARVLLPASAVLTFGFFMLLTRIHERHLLPTLPLLALTCALWPRFWPLLIWLSTAYLLNLHFVARGLFELPEPVLGRLEIPLVSALNVCALLALLALAGQALIARGLLARYQPKVYR